MSFAPTVWDANTSLVDEERNNKNVMLSAVETIHVSNNNFSQEFRLDAFRDFLRPMRNLEELAFHTDLAYNWRDATMKKLVQVIADTVGSTLRVSFLRLYGLPSMDYSAVTFEHFQVSLMLKKTSSGLGSLCSS